MSDRHTRTWRRAVLPWLAPAGGATLMALYVDPLLARHGVPGVVRWPASAAIVATLMLPPAMALAARRSDDFGLVRYAFRPGTMATACTAALAGAQLLVKASGTPLPGGPIVVAVGLVVVWTATYQFASETQAALARRLLMVREEAHADELLLRCRARLADPRVAPEERVVLELNAALALIVLSARTDADDRLDEAFALVEPVVETAPPPLGFAAARRMVDGMRAKALRTGDDVGWDQTLDLLAAAAERLADEPPEARGMVHAARAERLEWRAAPARARGDRKALLAGAAGELEAAAAATPERLDHHALHAAQLARVRAEAAGDGDLDDAIGQLQDAARRLRHAADPRDRDAARIALAGLLIRRADAVPYGATGRAVMEALDGHPLQTTVERLWIDRGTNDLMRAMTLLMSVDERTDEAAELLPGLRERMTRSLRFVSLPRWSDRQTGWMYRKVARKQAGASADRAAATALKWAEWAEARGDHQQAADAAWRWVTASAADLRRRVLEDKEPRVRDLQLQFAAAADRLVRAGRTAEAAIALDRGRAVLLTERTGRTRAGLEERLEAAERSDLAERWRAARARVEQADRAGYAATGAATGGGDRGSEEYRALAEHEGLVREIAALPGFDDVGAPPSYADLLSAAADGPLVYVVALDGRGFALVVVAGAPAPVAVPLPRLDRAWADDASARMATLGRGRPAARALTVLLRELWDRVLAQVAEAMELTPGTVVTLIPVGPLADLPLHAAATAPGADGLWHDRFDEVVFRYAPNARVLLHARRAAAAHVGRAILTADGGAAPAPGAAESAAVLALAEHFGVDAVGAGDDADAVLAGLDAAGLWHLACHGQHDPDVPLDSALMLARALTLRELFARRRGGGRLAVMSTCWSTRLDQERRDEVVGFPSAMLQAGVAGVVSCQAEVDEDAIRLLTLGLLSRVLEGTPPSRALAEAQAWLRTSTNAELEAAFPYAYGPAPPGVDAGRWAAHRQFAEPWTWVVVNYTGA